MNDQVGAYRGYLFAVSQKVVHESSHAIAGTITNNKYIQYHWFDWRGGIQVSYQ